MTPIPANATLLIIPVEPQPPEGYDLVPDRGSYSGGWGIGNRATGYNHYSIPPYAPGDVIDGRTVKAVRAPVRCDEISPDDYLAICGSCTVINGNQCFPAGFLAGMVTNHKWVWLIELEKTT